MGNRCIRLGDDGLPDIVVVVPPGGRMLGLEVKSANGAMRPKQKQFRTSLTKAGGSYEVVRSLEQAMNAVAKAMGEGKWKPELLSHGATGGLEPN